MHIDMIQSLNKEVADLKEKVRLLTLDNDKLKAKLGDANGL